MKLIELGILFYFTFSTVAFSSAPAAAVPEKFSIDKALKSGEFSFTKGEKKVANHLAKIYELTEKGYINTKLVQKALKETRNYSLFSDYRHWLNDIHQIHQQKDSAALRQICERIAADSSTAGLQGELSERSALVCFNRYLKLLSQQSGLEKKNHGKDLEFFRKHAKRLVHPSNIETLSYFLSRFDRESDAWKNYSSKLTAHYLSTDEAPPKSLLRYMDITAELTRFIQIQGLKENTAQEVLFAELKKLVNKVYEAADAKEEPRKISKLLKEATTYYTLSHPHLPKPKSDNRFLGVGKALMRRGYYQPAREAFLAILQLNPKDEDILFEYMWTWLTQEDYKSALKQVAVRYGLDQSFSQLKDERLQFWIAFAFSETGNKKKSNEIFENLVSKSPLNYYAILASKYLSEHYKAPADQVYYQLANQGAKQLPPAASLDPQTKSAIKRLRIWGAMDFKPLLELERKTAIPPARSAASANSSDKLKRSTAILLSAAVLKEEENYLESFKLVYTGLRGGLFGLDRPVLDILFPTPYMQEVASNIESFDPLIAVSLIRQESGFNKRARSWVGARGLMQLMPNTARIYWRGVKTEHLYNPDINIKIGSKYLSMLMEKYDHNLVYALSAYNAGESRVKKWRQEYFHHTDSILHTIENIPFAETRKYVKLIFRNLFFYKMMDDSQQVADTKSVNKIFDVQLGFNTEKSN